MSRSHPGWVNAHTHVYAGLTDQALAAAGGGPRESYLERMWRTWWRLDRALDERVLRAIARAYVAESLLHGTTALVDHHESPNFIEGSLDVLADVCEELGMRALLSYAATERNGGREEARRGLAECRRFITTNERELVRGVVGLHASFTLSDETLREASELALRLGTVVHVHVAEDRHDVLDARRRGFESPLSRLASAGALPPGSIVGLGVHLGEESVRAAGERGLWIVQCPRANELAGGVHPTSFAASELVALGTDGLPSDPVEESQALYFAAWSREESVERAMGRARAGELLLAERFGPGLAHKAEVSLGHLEVGGRSIVRDGRLQTGDMEEIAAKAIEAAELVAQRMAAL